MIVRCNWCEWQGDESELNDEHCPNCEEQGYLMDMSEGGEDE